MTRAEFDASVVATINVKDYFPIKDSKRNIGAPKKQIAQTAVLNGYSNLVARHKKKPNIAGYDYDMKNSAGEKIDAGKS